jgi:hypothetical protein
MKNVMIIDGADNCAYDVFEVSDVFFSLLFPGKGQDIEFIEDVLARHESGKLDSQFSEMWRHLVPKKDVIGIHGILFYELEKKKKYYPTKRDSDLSENGGRASS